MVKTSANSHEIKYLSYKDYLILLFGVLERHYNQNPSDPLPNYTKEDSSGLKKVLDFCRDNKYYPTFYKKAAYLFVAIIEGHYYSNGNKRLAFVTLLYFLHYNNYQLVQDRQGELRKLAIYVADKKANKNSSFKTLQEYIERYLKEHI